MTTLPSRRAVLGAGGGIALAAAGGASLGLGARRGTAAPSGDRPLRIGYLPITDAAPLLVAHGRGHFDRAGVAVEEPIRLRTWASMGEALLAGTVDIVHLLFPMALQMRLDLGADIRVLGANHVDGSALTLGAGVDTVADLAGRTVAIPAWYSIHNVITQMILRDAGITPIIRSTPSASRGEVTLVPMAPADMIPALHAGSIGAFSVADPFNAMAETRGVGTIGRFLGDVWRSHPCCVTVATGDLVRGPAEQVQAVADALVLAQQDCREDREGSAAMLSERYLPQPPQAVAEAMGRPDAGHAHVENPDWNGENIDFTPVLRPGFTARLVTEMRDTLLDAPLGELDRIDPAASHDLVVQDAALRDAARRLDPGSLAGIDDPEEISP